MFSPGFPPPTTTVVAQAPMPFYGTPGTGSADDFVESARTGQLDAVQRALKAGVDVNAADRFGCVCACVRGWDPHKKKKNTGGACFSGVGVAVEVGQGWACGGGSLRPQPRQSPACKHYVLVVGWCWGVGMGGLAGRRCQFHPAPSSRLLGSNKKRTCGHWSWCCVGGFRGHTCEWVSPTPPRLALVTYC